MRTIKISPCTYNTTSKPKVRLTKLNKRTTKVRPKIRMIKLNQNKKAGGPEGPANESEMRNMEKCSREKCDRK